MLLLQISLLFFCFILLLNQTTSLTPSENIEYQLRTTSLLPLSIFSPSGYLPQLHNAQLGLESSDSEGTCCLGLVIPFGTFEGNCYDVRGDPLFLSVSARPKKTFYFHSRHTPSHIKPPKNARSDSKYILNKTRVPTPIPIERLPFIHLPSSPSNPTHPSILYIPSSPPSSLRMLYSSFLTSFLQSLRLPVPIVLSLTEPYAFQSRTIDSAPPSLFKSSLRQGATIPFNLSPTPSNSASQNNDILHNLINILLLDSYTPPLINSNHRHRMIQGESLLLSISDKKNPRLHKLSSIKAGVEEVYAGGVGRGAVDAEGFLFERLFNSSSLASSDGNDDSDSDDKHKCVNDTNSYMHNLRTNLKLNLSTKYYKHNIGLALKVLTSSLLKSLNGLSLPNGYVPKSLETLEDEDEDGSGGGMYELQGLVGYSDGSVEVFGDDDVRENYRN